MLGICLRWHRLWIRIISVLSRLIFVTAMRFIGCLKRSILMWSLILRQNRMSTGLLRIRRFSWKRILWGRLSSWMLAASTVSSGIIRYRRMKFMAICPWTGRICSLRKRRRSTRPVRIVPPRLRLTSWFWLIIGLMACR